jgi:hypothetical protein
LSRLQQVAAEIAHLASCNTSVVANGEEEHAISIDGRTEDISQMDHWPKDGNYDLRIRMLDFDIVVSAEGAVMYSSNRDLELPDTLELIDSKSEADFVVTLCSNLRCLEIASFMAFMERHDAAIAKSKVERKIDKVARHMTVTEEWREALADGTDPIGDAEQYWQYEKDIAEVAEAVVRIWLIDDPADLSMLPLELRQVVMEMQNAAIETGVDFGSILKTSKAIHPIGIVA